MADSPTRLLKDAGGTELGWLELRRTDGFYRLITGYKRVYCVLTNDALLYSSKSNGIIEGYIEVVGARIEAIPENLNLQVGDSLFKLATTMHLQACLKQLSMVAAYDRPPARPVWVPDASIDNCTSCQSLFTPMLRKHHCRTCGRVICKYCVVNFSSKLIRSDDEALVCVLCRPEEVKDTFCEPPEELNMIQEVLFKSLEEFDERSWKRKDSLAELQNVTVCSPFLQKQVNLSLAVSVRDLTLSILYSGVLQGGFYENKYKASSCDGRFLIESITRSQWNYLKNHYMQAYSNHVSEFPNSFLPKIYFSFRLPLKDNSSMYFVVTNNILWTSLDVQEVFELRGVPVPRVSVQPAALRQIGRPSGAAVLDDIDFEVVNRSVSLKNARMLLLLITQAERDMDFLRSVSSYEYTLILGIHSMELGTPPTTSLKVSDEDWYDRNSDSVRGSIYQRASTILEEVSESRKSSGTDLFEKLRVPGALSKIEGKNYHTYFIGIVNTLHVTASDVPDSYSSEFFKRFCSIFEP